jgi:hypothetical protein
MPLRLRQRLLRDSRASFASDRLEQDDLAGVLCSSAVACSQASRSTDLVAIIRPDGPAHGRGHADFVAAELPLHGPVVHRAASELAWDGLSQQSLVR